MGHCNRVDDRAFDPFLNRRCMAKGWEKGTGEEKKERNGVGNVHLNDGLKYCV